MRRDALMTGTARPPNPVGTTASKAVEESSPAPDVARSTRLRLAVSLLPALGVFAFVVGIGVAVESARPAQWTASSSFAVFPATLTPEAEASFYETLSRGQIISTIAQVVASQPQELAPASSVQVEVIPETSLVRLVATAPDAETAQRLADERLTTAVAAVEELGIPFSARAVDEAADTVQEIAPARAVNLSIAVIAAAVLALVVQQAIALAQRSSGKSSTTG